MVRALGIDLGTTYTVVATLMDGRAAVLPNAEGQHLTPSVVAFTDEGEPLVGQQAKNQAVNNPDRTVFSIKRRMGSDYRVRVADEEYSPQQISSLILGKVKADAEDFLGERIELAVITVPAYFNDRQRQATKAAGHLAGLDVMRIINEPTAAALTYGLEREDAHTILVWDLGGGTYDISLLELGEGIFEVRAVSGDPWLGGDDFDKRVMDYLEAEYRRGCGVDFPADPGARRTLRAAAERAKIQLSTARLARVSVPLPDASAPRRLEIALSREQLEHLTGDLLQRMVAPVEQALDDAGLTPADVDRVILVGGATRMPAIRQLARKILGKEPYRYIDPDRIVALGSAIQAGILLGTVGHVVLLDVLPLSLGVETQGGLMTRIIPRNTPLPAQEARVFITAVDNQTAMDIHVLQGERELAVDNVSLGRFQFSGIPSAPKGAPKVEVAFEADVDGIVHVTAKDLLTDQEMKVNVTSTKLLDPWELEGLAVEAHRNATEDRRKRAVIEVGIETDNVLAAAEQFLEETGSLLAGREVQAVRSAIGAVKRASASGTVKATRRRCGELRQLVAAIHSAQGKPSSSGRYGC